MKNSIERIYPESIKDDEVLGRETLQLHLQRYHFAGKHLLKGRVADIACGVGYGSALLVNDYGDGIESITAVDIDHDAISYAQLHYTHPKINFVVSDGLQFYSTQDFQNIISLETIEHLPNPAAFVTHLSKQLQVGGHFIASVPITPSMDANPFHLQDFTATSFRKMFSDAGFIEVVSMQQLQPYSVSKIFLKKDKRVEDMRKNILGYYLKHPSKFLLRIRSLFTDGFSNKYMITVFKKL